MKTIAYTTTKTMRAAGAATYLVNDYASAALDALDARREALDALAADFPRRRKCFALGGDGIARPVDIGEERSRIAGARLSHD